MTPDERAAFLLSRAARRVRPHTDLRMRSTITAIAQTNRIARTTSVYRGGCHPNSVTASTPEMPAEPPVKSGPSMSQCSKAIPNSRVTAAR